MRGDFFLILVAFYFQGDRNASANPIPPSKITQIRVDLVFGAEYDEKEKEKLDSSIKFLVS